MSPVGGDVVGPGVSTPPAAGVANPVSAVSRTPSTGFAFVNAVNQTICSWTAPSDGEMHPVQVNTTLLAGAGGGTGGAVRLIWTSAGQQNFTSVQGGGMTGNQFFNATENFVVDPGTTVTLQQQTALSGGQVTAYAAITAA